MDTFTTRINSFIMQKRNKKPECLKFPSSLKTILIWSVFFFFDFFELCFFLIYLLLALHFLFYSIRFLWYRTGFAEFALYDWFLFLWFRLVILFTLPFFLQPTKDHKMLNFVYITKSRNNYINTKWFILTEALLYLFMAHTWKWKNV